MKKILPLIIAVALESTIFATIGFAQSAAFSIPFSSLKTYEGFGPVITVSAKGKDVEFILDTGVAPTMVVESSKINDDASRFKTCSKRLSVNVGAHYQVGLLCKLIPGIPEFAEANISGLLSPQSFATTSLVVMDFVTKNFSLYELNGKSPDQEFRKIFPTRSFIQATRVGSSIGAIFVKARLGTREEVLIDIDTGSPYTYFSKRYVGEVLLLGNFPVKNIAGEETTTSQAAQAELLTLGGKSLVMVSAKLWDEPQSAAGIIYDGAIGRDALASCAIGIAPQAERYIYLACE